MRQRAATRWTNWFHPIVTVSPWLTSAILMAMYESPEIERLAEVIRLEGSAQPVEPHGGLIRDKMALLARLKRVEGQVRGLQRMVEADRDCPAILEQVAAVRAALGASALLLLKEHTRGCIVDAIRAGKEQAALEELIALVGKLMGRT